MDTEKAKPPVGLAVLTVFLVLCYTFIGWTMGGRIGVLLVWGIVGLVAFILWAAMVLQRLGRICDLLAAIEAKLPPGPLAKMNKVKE